MTLTYLPSRTDDGDGSSGSKSGSGTTERLVGHGSRAGSEVRRFTLTNGLCFLWTLTYREAPLGRGEVVRHLRRFFERLQGAYGRFPMLAVIERGKRGTKRLHCHLAVPLWLNHAVLQTLWSRGWVWVGDGSRCPGQPGMRRLSRYLAKYLKKELEQEALGQVDRAPGEHRYYRTQGHTPTRLSFRFEDPRRAIRAMITLIGTPAHAFAYGGEGPREMRGYWIRFEEDDWWPAPDG